MGAQYTSPKKHCTGMRMYRNKNDKKGVFGISYTSVYQQFFNSYITHYTYVMITIFNRLQIKQMNTKSLESNILN